jgi:uracil-DNA glycosylase
VFGEGSAPTSVMFVGEQPGDKEDVVGRPFVGPAGRILDEALEAAGIDRSEVYLTNIVKHFSWVPDRRGNRRIHKKPRYSEIQACRPWFDAEIKVTRAQLNRLSWRNCRAGLAGKEFQRDSPTRTIHRVFSRSLRNGDRSSLIRPACSQ